MGKQVGVHCVRGDIDHQECRRCALLPEHPCDYTPDMLELMRVDYDDPDREPGVDSYTPTRLLGCARQPVLMGEADYYVDVEYAWPLVRGNMVHALMETARYPGATEVIREYRFRTEIETPYGPKLFTAKPDIVVEREFTTDNGVLTIHLKIVDYKSTNEIGHDLVEARWEHQLQVNMYAWIVKREWANNFLAPDEIEAFDRIEVVVDEIEVVYVSMKKVRRFTSGAGRFTKGKMTQRRPPEYAQLWLEPMVLMSNADIEKFIREQITTRIEAEEVLPNILEGDEAWRCERCPVRQFCYSIGNVGQPKPLIQLTRRVPK